MLVEAKTYRKAALTHARLLTTTDREVFGDKIQTKEGAVSWKPGDYLACGVAGEIWPISAATMERTKHKVNEPDQEGWADYEATNTVRATQMQADFTATLSTNDSLAGKAGDYLVEDGKRKWVVDRDIFEKTYVEA